ncbi:prefoldin subunit 1 [Tribolium castaneum]|uniref:Prefoldin subunit 1-like Protein n=1 Tax=Tribolium castaneum TaxID=7070 RepID=D6WDY6_TRICA|nr:PREDICTED: prefoldin subunit 1 [Tribolium castaneum]EFA01203.1 Prefoldin subunit 1-like Protein [Tribolium castaneum]|eukprot:XP_968083.1 PREDICTED: prefoldin subunit 1 [Tribolium castaneum]
MSKVDMELKKAFAELQEKQIDTAQKLRIADLQIETLKRNKQHASFTEREISSLEEGTKTYESVGRMFVMTPMTQVKENLQKKQAQAEEKIKVLVNNKTYLENSLKDATNSLRELVQQKKES